MNPVSSTTNKSSVTMRPSMMPSTLKPSVMDDYDCPEVKKPIKSLQKGPPTILRKSLTAYFDERIGDRVKTQEFYNYMMQEKVSFSVSAEETTYRQEVACLDRLLVNEREEWAKEKAEFDIRWQDAKTRQEEMIHRIPHFNGYYKDQFTKRDRCERQIAHELEQIVIKNQEIRVRKKELEKLKAVHDESKTRLGYFAVFKRYLDKVREASHGEYPHIKGLMDRYVILADTREKLKEMTEEFRTTIEKRQQTLTDDTANKSEEVVIYREYLGEMLEYDKVLREKVVWLEDGLYRVKVTAAKRTLILGQIKLAIYNIYRIICKALFRHEKLMTEDVFGQLSDIRLSVQEMTHLCQDIKRMMKAARLTARQEQAARNKLAIIQAERERKLKEFLYSKGRAFKSPKELFELPEKSDNQMTTIFFPNPPNEENEDDD